MTAPVAGDKISVLIVDDEPLARDGIRLLLEKHREFAIIGEVADGNGAVSAIISKLPDLVFLDVQMPGAKGFEVVARIPIESRPVVVFVTAYDTFAVKAFDANALDYLLKPIDPARFEITIDRIKAAFRDRKIKDYSDRLTNLLAETATKKTPACSREYLKRLAVKERNRTVLVKVDDIIWIEAQDDYVCLHTHGKTHILRESLSNLETSLDPSTFRRIHRSTIANVACIKELRHDPPDSWFVILSDGTSLKSGRQYKAALDEIAGGRP